MDNMDKTCPVLPTLIHLVHKLHHKKRQPLYRMVSIILRNKSLYVSHRYFDHSKLFQDLVL